MPLLHSNEKVSLRMNHKSGYLQYIGVLLDGKYVTFCGKNSLKRNVICHFKYNRVKKWRIYK